MPTQADIRQNVTDQILTALKEGGLPPWRKPWSDDPNAPGLHTSLSTGQGYRGINQLILQASAIHSGYKSRWWGTFNQVRQNGAHVRKGEKGTYVVLWKPICRNRIDQDGDEIAERFLIMRQFVVFNAEQTTGLNQFRIGFTKPKETAIQRYEQADRVIEATQAKIEYGGNRSCYCPETDTIELPYRHQFETAEAYYETSFHELCHWSESRTGWDRRTNQYALGELIAEIGACFLMGELGLPTGETMTNSQAYLQNWLQGMENDTRFIFSASAQASRAADFILSFSQSPVEEAIPF